VVAGPNNAWWRTILGRSGGGAAALTAIGCCLCFATPAGAQPDPEAAPDPQADADPDPEAAPDPNRWEPGVLPAINYDSDIGFGFGAIGSLARFEEGFNPYRFRVLAQLFMSAKQDASGTVGIPFHDHAIGLDMPGLLDDLLRLNASLAFGKFTNTGYYGLGNASEARSFSGDELEDSEVARRFHTYGHTYPSAKLNGRFKLFEQPATMGKRRLEALAGFGLGYHWVDVYGGSRLAQDIEIRESNSADGRTLSELLHGTEDHVSLAFNLGLLWDTRDHEFAPNRGTFTELSTRIFPGVDEELRYLGITFATSWFAPLIHEHLVVATRAVADVLVGDPPVFALSEYGVLVGGAGPGGSGSVRGVPLRRYHGKLKTLLNFELRGAFPRVMIFGERMRFGLVGFADAGRVWTDWEGRSLGGQDLDGPYSPFKAGVGGGGRMQWAETFIVRADFGYSPTDETTGFYIDIGHVF
jgi:hypothetical protein